MSDKSTATDDRADELNAAIDYAFEVQREGMDGLAWLDEWRHGDPEAMAALAAWRKSA